MSNRTLFIIPVLLLTVTGATLAQKAAESTDGEAHGDPPYLSEPGWTPLLNGTDLAGWHTQDGKPLEWITTRAVRWDRYGPTHLSGKPAPGGSMMNSTKGKTSNIVTDPKFGDVELYLEFMVAQGSNSGVYLQGLYEIQVFDSYGAWEKLTSSDCGGIYQRWINNRGVGGSAPKVNACRRPGEWQSFQIWFRAPRFDASGKKIENARFLRVLQNGLPVQEDVAVDGPTRSHMLIEEAPLNPLMLQGDHGPVAYRNIYVRPLRPIISH
jgi:hypothetical protein